MKKLFFAIFGAALLLASCAPVDLYVDQNPNRAVIEYTPGTFSMEVPGSITPASTYDWLTFTQSGNTVNFTAKRNTTGLIRRAEFSIAGQPEKLLVFQKAHRLDAKLSAEVMSQSIGSATIATTFYTDFSDDYESWGLAYGKTSELSSAKELPQGSITNLGKLIADVDGLEDGVDYYFWPYVISTEGDKVYGSMLAVIPPVYIKEVCDLQAAIDGAKAYQEVRLLGGLTFPGGINILDNNKNKAISGGWNDDFSAQSMDNLTVIDGNGKTFGFNIAADDSDKPINGYVKISYLEIQNCTGGHGAGIHICGGPLTVNNCYFHNNDGEKGAAIGTREEDYSSYLDVYNCIFENNTANGHGAVLGLGDGANTTDYVKANVVSNLFINNRSVKFGGYASIFICYNNTELNFINNTVVGNFNYYDGDAPYEGMKFRGNTRVLLANNIIVGNIISEDKLLPPVEKPHPNYIGLGNSHAVFANNIIAGDVTENGNLTDVDNQYIPADASYSNILDSNYKPLGTALGAGTFGTFEPSFENGSTNPTSVQTILDKFYTDLAGNARVTNGKVDLGCYQAQ